MASALNEKLLFSSLREKRGTGITKGKHERHHLQILISNLDLSHRSL